MMSRLTLTTALSFLCSAVMPLTAHAYLTPDEVLNEGDFSVRFYEPPPSKREIEAAVAEQQRVSAERREAEQAALEREGEEDEPTHEAAPDEPTDDESDLDALIKALEEWQASQNEGGMDDDDEPTHNAADSDTQSAVEQRLLERLRDRDGAARTAAYQAWVNGQQGELHGGAPLSETGPASIVALVILAGAVGETWRRVRKAERA